MTITDVDEIVAGPVSRVIIRDPEATVEDFVGLASRLGLHGTDYVVGWTAWLDLSAVGVSKASGLQHVADALGRHRRGRPGDRRRPQRHRDAPVGRPGVAMGQSVQEVHDAADASTGDVYEDGAAVELDRWFREGAGAPRTQGFRSCNRQSGSSG